MFEKYLENFTLYESQQQPTKMDILCISAVEVKRYTNEFWTAKQRQANSLHEISYRACFKPQLPRFFIEKLTQENDVVYDPFLGRGTTLIEAGLLNRKVIGNDVNPLSLILCESRFLLPNLADLKEYLEAIPMDKTAKETIDLSMFYHPDTLLEIVSLKNYILEKEKNNTLNSFDRWIRMVATNRLTGHSSGFFSVYTMPPNQAVSAKRQLKINETRNQTPTYRNVKEIILKKSKTLLKNITEDHKKTLKTIHQSALFINKDARNTPEIPSNSVQLTVTSPPFLDIVQYAQDNWLRSWFNGIDIQEVEKNITMSKTLDEWNDTMQEVFAELFRITKTGGYVAFEVGEVRNGKIRLDESVISIGLKAGFTVVGILINEQNFTKTANIWGVKNNTSGTNTNRIVVFRK